MNVFSRKNPKLSSSDRTSNVKAKNIYRHMLGVANKCTGSGANYTGTVRFDICGNVINFRNYELARSMAKGSALISDCNCNGMSEPGGPETWNANGTIFNGGGLPIRGPLANGAQTMAYLSNSNGWIADRLDNDGGAGATDAPGGTLDGSGVWIDPNNHLFGKYDDCETDKFLTYVGLTGSAIDLKGNDTKKNYLFNYAPIGSGISTKAGIGRSLRPLYNNINGITNACCTDSKASWKLINFKGNSPNRKWNDIKISGDGRTIVVLEDSNSGGLWVSKNSGISWSFAGSFTGATGQKVTLSENGQYIVVFTSSTALFGGKGYYSLDSGLTLNDVAVTVSPAAGSPFSTITSNYTGKYVYALKSWNSGSGQSSGGARRSLTYGTSWTFLAGGLSSQRSWIASATNELGNVVLVSAKASSTISGDGELWLSTNYGNNFSQILSTSGLPVASNISWNGLASDALGKILYAADNNGGNVPSYGYIWRSVDFGVTWAIAGSLQKDWNVIRCSASGKELIATTITTTDYVWLSNNYGNTWTRQDIGSNNITEWNAVDISKDGKSAVAINYYSFGSPIQYEYQMWVFNDIDKIYYQ